MTLLEKWIWWMIDGEWLAYLLKTMQHSDLPNQKGWIEIPTRPSHLLLGKHLQIVNWLFPDFPFLNGLEFKDLIPSFAVRHAEVSSVCGAWLPISLGLTKVGIPFVTVGKDTGQRGSGGSETKQEFRGGLGCLHERVEAGRKDGQFALFRIWLYPSVGLELRALPKIHHKDSLGSIFFCSRFIS